MIENPRKDREYRGDNPILKEDRKEDPKVLSTNPLLCVCFSWGASRGTPYGVISATCRYFLGDFP
jgi:hypothetical protein